MIEIYTIWAILESEGDTPWLVEAWDEYSIEENGAGWDEAVERAKSENNGNIRIIKSLIDYAAVAATFSPASVDLKGVEVSA